MRDRRMLVQFIHPGSEHAPDRDEVKDWNVDAHRRKFLVSPGRYLDRGRPRSTDLWFWGEWEAQSRVVRQLGIRGDDGPRFLYEPYYQPPASWKGVWLQNTDPFVFGDCFLYAGCLQHTRNGPTQLRHLDRGSVILFGSCRGLSRFVIDAVFVVNRWIDHGAIDYREKLLRGAVSKTYADVTIAPWYSGDVPKGRSHRLYFGATWESPVDGMFSFFPCVPASDAGDGVARPTIAIEGSITPHLTQGKKLIPIVDDEPAFDLWSAVVDQVETQGLHLELSTELPPKTGTMSKPVPSRGKC